MANLKVKSKMRIVMSFDVLFDGSIEELSKLDQMASSLCSENFDKISLAFKKPVSFSNPQFCIQKRRDQMKDGVVVSEGSPPIENTIFRWGARNAG